MIGEGGEADLLRRMRLDPREANKNLGVMLAI